MAHPLQLPKFTTSTDTWGPSATKNVPFADLPFAPFTKSTPINFIADFTPNAWGGTMQNRNRRGGDDEKSQRFGRGGRTRMGDEDAVLGDFSDNDADFGGSIVRTKKYDERKGRKDWTAHRAKMVEAHDKLARAERNRLEHAPKSKYRPKQAALRRKRRKKMYENPRPTIASIKKQDSWQLQCDLWFNSMHDLNSAKTPHSKFNTIISITRAGTLSRIRKEFDAIRCRTPSPLLSYKYSDNKYIHFDYVSASNDPILLDNAFKANKREISMKLKNPNAKRRKQKWRVFTTDTIMALLMCITRSKYSFDFVITKIGNNIFLDQRNKTNSYWHVDETSQNRPTKKGTMNMNKHNFLCKEATLVNRILNEQLVSHKLQNIANLEKNHPFQANLIASTGGHPGDNSNNASSNSSSLQQTPQKGNNNNISSNNSSLTNTPSQQQSKFLASKGFVYKAFDLLGARIDSNESKQQRNESKNDDQDVEYEDDIRIYARCCAHGFDGPLDKSRNASKSRNLSYVNIYGLNQYDHLKSKTSDWNKELDLAMSGILLTEIANNAFKIARWTIESYLVGCDKVKLAFVTRTRPQSSSNDHQINGVKSFSVKDLLYKCNINLRHQWSVLKHIIQLIQKFELDGRYICVRDPLKQVVRFYKCDDNAFGKDDELPSYRHVKKIISFTPSNDNTQS